MNAAIRANCDPGETIEISDFTYKPNYPTGECAAVHLRTVMANMFAERLETFPDNLANVSAIAQPYFVPSPELAIGDLHCSSTPEVVPFAYEPFTPFAMIDVRTVH